MKKSIYRMWWQDGSDQEVFKTEDVPKMAMKFAFDPEELLLNGEVTFFHMDGDVIGGVTTDEYEGGK